MAVARSTSKGDEIYYVLPVFWMTLWCLPTMGYMARGQGAEPGAKSLTLWLDDFFWPISVVFSFSITLFCFCSFGSVQRIKMAIHQFLDAHMKLTKLWFLHPTWHKIGHFWDIPQANLLPLGACNHKSYIYIIYILHIISHDVCGRLVMTAVKEIKKVEHKTKTGVKSLSHTEICI